MPKEIVDTGDAHLNLLIGFWKNLRDDLRLKGIITDSLPKKLRRSLSYEERVKIERRLLQESALRFVNDDSDEELSFYWWARNSGLDPEQLRKELLNEYCP